ncbi:hypothetical protein [Mesobacillus foraminis]|uniref:Uncharacterized protein n=1 Tax=Mesobacillus foraminis TaxID=279826 RepID=A0A4V2RDU5_9BACI|nr:hypothetical protein [Mesobacillus foraminis]TCN26220.1 hypothetical protein EV146_104330 [Mesobacillus foraminis]
MKAKIKLESERKGLHEPDEAQNETREREKGLHHPVKNENSYRETKETRRTSTTHSFLKENLYQPKQMRRQKKDCWYVG